MDHQAYVLRWKLPYEKKKNIKKNGTISQWLCLSKLQSSDSLELRKNCSSFFKKREIYSWGFIGE